MATPRNSQTIDCENPRCDKSSALVYHCVDCASNYCSLCWPLQGPHRPGKVGRDGVPHEKTSLEIVNRLRNILQPQETSTTLHELHTKDHQCKWFGVTRDQSSRLRFHDHGRYSALISSISPTAQHVHRYPQLVSFIGVTNAGKSTIIKMLISRSLANYRGTLEREAWPSPIVGSPLHDSVPTSGDVNLYADPHTHTQPLPILYADCEGFEGGERLPIGAMERRRGGNDTQNTRSDMSSTSRVIEWANTDDTKQREFAVANLYPRLLYTFSDVVVFVLRNPKTFQSSVLSRLVDWGVSSLEKSINQPSLPHCLVVLNATEPSANEQIWDTAYATQALLSSVKSSLENVEGVPKLRKLAEHWTKLGKNIHTVEDLILQYYSSFQVIRIPTKPRYMLIDQQIGRLHDAIVQGCQKSFYAKRKARMLTNADELHAYFEAGFSHFTTHLDLPFNFVEVSLKQNPIPSDFGGHILQLAIAAMRYLSKTEEDLIWLFGKLSVMLASCVFLDCARFRKGRMVHLFHNYEQFFDWALAEIFEMHWQCTFTSQGRKCALVKARHDIKGHQDIHGIIAAGDYEPGFSLEPFVAHFKSQLVYAIATIQRDFSFETENGEANTLISDETIALPLHSQHVTHFFSSLGGADRLVSHTSCFLCLMNVPEHALPCGHAICPACVKAYGKRVGRSTILMQSCPMHPEETCWLRPPRVHLKPKGAGVRVLSLDGGGVRGVVQLELLREIEQALDNHFPIACFFDLIVGTGTGGVIATALGQHRRVYPEIIDMFASLCDVAFAPRLQSMPVLRIASMLGGGSAYKTKPMRKALATTFGSEQKMFGGKVDALDIPRTKVGVTATTGTGRNTVLLTNYRRPDGRTAFYEFDRPSDPDHEMLFAEAMAATTATPGYFRPFIHSRTHRTYIDGSIRCVNPALIAENERKLIWKDVAHRDPDVLLSLGTGQYRFQVLTRMGDHAKGASQMEHAETLAGQNAKTTGLLRQFANLLSNRADDVLEAEMVWASFKATLPNTIASSNRHYIRLNPDLDTDPPAIDAKGDLRSLQQTVRKKLWLPHRQIALAHVGYRLIASSFYFDSQIKKKLPQKAHKCSGIIACRFDNGSEHLKAMGRFLESKKMQHFQPHFLIRGGEKDERGMSVSKDSPCECSKPLTYRRL